MALIFYPTFDWQIFCTVDTASSDQGCTASTKAEVEAKYLPYMVYKQESLAGVTVRYAKIDRSITPSDLIAEIEGELAFDLAGVDMTGTLSDFVADSQFGGADFGLGGLSTFAGDDQFQGVGTTPSPSPTSKGTDENFDSRSVGTAATGNDIP